MSGADYEFHSPLTLLSQWRAGGARLVEMLVVGFTVDLVFLERFCVPVARGLGARVTVLGDAHQAVHDPVDVRNAGRSYQHGHVVCRGAFHPKVVVLLGENEVWAAIGSGNPTMSGWGHNHELWLVARSPLSQGPAVLRDLSDWLTALPDAVDMPSWIADTVHYIGRMISPAVIGGDDDVVLLHNLHRSIIGQLPASAMHELVLSAPFFDHGGSALRALVARLNPRQLKVGLQERLTSYDGAALVAACGEVPVEFTFLDDGRTRHGKLVEWVDEHGRTSLIGSANVTAAALLNSVADGGNCELVVSRATGESLLPEGNRVSAHRVAAARAARPEQPAQRPTLTLLGCRRLDGALQVELRTSEAMQIRVETSADGSPSSWQPVMSFPAERAGRVEHRDQVPEHAGAVVRTIGLIGPTEIISQHAFLTDIVRCLPRTEVADQPRLHRTPEVDRVFTDPVLAKRFNTDLLRLIQETEQTKAATPAVVAQPVVVRERFTDDRWGAFLHEVRSMLGDSLTQLIFPGSWQEQADSMGEWTVGSVDDNELADDEDESVVDSSPTEPPRVESPSERTRYRRWARRWARAVCRGAQPLSLRMTVACLYLDLLAAGVWERDQEWRADLRQLVGALVRVNESELPNEALEYRNTLVATCLALLRQDAIAGSESDLAEAAWHDGWESAAYASVDLIDGFLRPSDQVNAVVVTASEVEEEIKLAEAASDDPHAPAVESLAQQGIHVEKVDGVWLIAAAGRYPLQIAAQVATMLGPGCVRAESGKSAVVLLWHGETLAMINSAVPRWRMYQLKPPRTPKSLFAEIGLPPARATHPRSPIPDHVAELGIAIGVDIEHVLAEL